MGHHRKNPGTLPRLTPLVFVMYVHDAPRRVNRESNHGSRHYLYLHLTLKLQQRHASPECANIPFRTSKRCPGVKSRQIFTTLMLFSCEPRGLTCLECKPLLSAVGFGAPSCFHSNPRPRCKAYFPLPFLFLSLWAAAENSKERERRP